MRLRLCSAGRGRWRAGCRSPGPRPQLPRDGTPRSSDSLSGQHCQSIVGGRRPSSTRRVGPTMRRPTRRTLKGTGLAVLSVLAVVGGGTIAWGHGAVSPGGDRVHTCVRGSVLRTLRVVTPAQACTSSEQGIDFPHSGTLIGVDFGAPVTTSFTATANVISGPITVACTPDPAPPGLPIHRAVGATVSQTQDLALAVTRSASPTAWEVAFVAPTAGVKTVTVTPICMPLFQQ